jgi:hypothetical protein
LGTSCCLPRPTRSLRPSPRSYWSISCWCRVTSSCANLST